jgi:hypothetical protein
MPDEVALLIQPVESLKHPEVKSMPFAKVEVAVVEPTESAPVIASPPLMVEVPVPPTKVVVDTPPIFI